MEHLGLSNVTEVTFAFDKKSFWGGDQNGGSFASMYVYGRREHSFFSDRADGRRDMRHRDSEVQRTACFHTEAQRLRERQNLFLFTATTTARETEDGLEDGLAKPKPFAVL